MLTYIEQIPYMGVFIITLAVWGIRMGLYYCIKRENPKITHIFWLLLSSGYAVIFIVFYIWPVSFKALSPEYNIGKVQMIPFHTMMQTSCLHIAGNLAIPFLLPFLLHYNFLSQSVKKTMLYSLLVAAMIEPVQLMINRCTHFPNFVVDIDDWILQVIGCAIGVGVISFWRLVIRKDQFYKRPPSGRCRKR